MNKSGSWTTLANLAGTTLTGQAYQVKLAEPIRHCDALWRCGKPDLFGFRNKANKTIDSRVAPGYRRAPISALVLPRSV
jgi:hypothetical protein